MMIDKSDLLVPRATNKSRGIFPKAGWPRDHPTFDAVGPILADRSTNIHGPTRPATSRVSTADAGRTRSCTVAGQMLILPARRSGLMVGPVPHPGEEERPPFPDQAILGEMERITEPAILYLPGGVIASVNTAASRLAGLDMVGRSMNELIGQSSSRRADGTRLLPRDLPFMRALRGEVVEHGERIDIHLPGGSLYRALVTSTPVIRDGQVVAALSVWYDFDAYVRTLAGDGRQ